jgi:SAM-dependent methyltransferase
LTGPAHIVPIRLKWVKRGWDPDRVDDRNEDHQDLIRRSFRRQVDRFTGPDSPFAGSPDAPPWVGPLAPDLLVLEAACGAAHVAETIAPHVWQVVALDLTPELLAVAAGRLRDAGVDNVLLQEGNVEQLPFVAESFDLVVCRGSLHHFLNPRRALAEMVRVCRVGGRVAVNDLVAPEAASRDAFDDLHRALDPSHVCCFLAGELEHAWPEGVAITHEERMDVRLPIDIAITEQSDRGAVLAALEAELAGGPATGFAPERGDDGQMVVSFLTHTLRVTKGDDEAS